MVTALMKVKKKERNNTHRWSVWYDLWYHTGQGVLTLLSQRFHWKVVFILLFDWI